MKKTNNIFSLKNLSILMGVCCLLCINNESFAASRTTVRPVATTARKPAVKATPTANTTTTVQQAVEEVEIVEEIEPEPLYIENKSSQFEDVVSTVTDGVEDNAFAEQIRKQRNAFDVSESSNMLTQQQQAALASGRNSCDAGLRECMMAKCGNDFTKCALDGDTIFGDKLNACRKDLTCTGEEFRLFTTEIKADRDLNAKLSSYTKVIDCGNNYNKCMVEECGNTYTQCLGKAAADKAIQKCSTIAKQCTEQDSGLASRFGTVIGKLRETAEQDVKTDEARMYTIRDTMKTVCSGLGAMFDERSFDCVFTVNFFAGENQSTPMASRKRYAGDTFVCLQEWFGTNVTTFKENAFRETRAQTAASSAMLGSGVGTAAGLISSGAIDRALDTQKAKKELKKEQKAHKEENQAEDKAACEENANMEWVAGKCKEKKTKEEKSNEGKGCAIKVSHAKKASYNANNECIVSECNKGYKLSSDNKSCEEDTEQKEADALAKQQKKDLRNAKKSLKEEQKKTKEANKKAKELGVPTNEQERMSKGLSDAAKIEPTNSLAAQREKNMKDAVGGANLSQPSASLPPRKSSVLSTPNLNMSVFKTN